MNIHTMHAIVLFLFLWNDDCGLSVLGTSQVPEAAWEFREILSAVCPCSLAEISFIVTKSNALHGQASWRLKFAHRVDSSTI